MYCVHFTNTGSNIWQLSNIPLSIAQTSQFQLGAIQLGQPNDDPREGSLNQQQQRFHIQTAQLNTKVSSSWRSPRRLYLLHWNMLPVVIQANRDFWSETKLPGGGQSIQNTEYDKQTSGPNGKKIK